MRSTKGFTLIELMVSLAVLSILLSIALPSFRDAFDRQRIKAAAETLQGNFYLAKTEALKTGKAAYFSVQAGACYGFKLGAPCNCAVASGDVDYCPLARTEIASSGPVALFATSFDEDGATIDSVRGMSTSGSVTWKSQRGYVAKTAITLVGRVHVCSPAGEGNLSGYPSANC